MTFDALCVDTFQTSARRWIENYVRKVVSRLGGDPPHPSICPFRGPDRADTRLKGEGSLSLDTNLVPILP
jgi:hypothetical protein